jgi:Ca-activated chloride channel family protein
MDDGGDPELEDATPESLSEETPQVELRAANEQEEGTPQEATEEVGVEVTDRMTEEEARKMLQAIRDRDMLRRLRRQAAERSRRIPVERDW